MSGTDLRFYAPCQSCKRNTRHKVMREISESSNDDDYRFSESHEIIQCQGCDQKSFRYIFRDEENAYLDERNDWDVPEEINYYPKYNPKHDTLEHVSRIPELVQEIYKESMLAVQAGALTLAGLGLRGTIEAVCNERGISGRNLETRISKMATQGLISSKDAERLHAIRFLGNDAAHDIKKPKENQISVAIKIINHLIQSVYLLEIEIHHKLDTIITDYLDFVGLLNKSLRGFSTGDEYPLVKFLGRDVRRLHGGISALQAMLEKEIASGDYTKLAIGKVDIFQGSKDRMQHFTVK